jgi:hypothetical protein
MKCCICGAVKNCGPYLNKVFKNMELIGTLFEDYKIFLFYDNSKDNTLNLLKEYKNKNNNFFFYENIKDISKYRTIRLAYARNTCINFVNTYCIDYNFFIMMDCDEVCSSNINLNVLQKYLQREDWDGLTFNKKDYYDIWALSKYPYMISFFHFKDNRHDKIKKYITNLLSNLKEGELLRCCSSFNGFGIYRKEKFINCIYNGIFNANLFSKDVIEKNISALNSRIDLNRIEDCEHRSFHVQANFKNNAKIFISSEILFPSNNQYKNNNINKRHIQNKIFNIK